MRYWAYVFSAVLILSGVASLVIKGGPKLGIDFTGGALVQLGFKESLPLKDVREALKNANYPDVELQDFHGAKSVIIRVGKGETDANALAKKLQAAIAAKYPASSPEIERAEFVGPAVGRALANQAFWALVWSMHSTATARR